MIYSDEFDSTTPDLGLSKSYYVIGRVFRICSACRWFTGQNPRSWRRQLRHLGCSPWPRLSFWTRLLQNAGLLERGIPPRPTPFVSAWLARPVDEQMQELLNAWLGSPGDRTTRRLRQNLIDRLAQNPDGSTLPESYRKQLTGLQSLGLCDQATLTPLGSCVLRQKPIQSAEVQSAPWSLQGFSLTTPDPLDWALAWELEAYFQPFSPGRYSLAPASLRLAVQMGDRGILQRILEQGLSRPLPETLKALVSGQPVIQLLSGATLEFSDPAELARLRRLPGLRRCLDALLSPRHVFLTADHVKPALNSLRRHGIVILGAWDEFEPPASQATVKHGSSSLAEEELAELYALARLSQSADLGISVSPRLVARLERRLSPVLKQAAARQAGLACQRLAPGAARQIADEPDAGAAGDTLTFLQAAIEREEGVDILYLAAGRASPERRHITPLLIEPRGPHQYLVAYCHSRRANRTFRLDRLSLAGA